MHCYINSGSVMKANYEYFGYQISNMVFLDKHTNMICVKHKKIYFKQLMYMWIFGNSKL